jgi:ISXO2-like transposase domain/Transposase zinc-ribbon domain
MKNAPSIIDVKTKFGSTEQCVAYLEKMRWPDGVRCLVCGCAKISKFVTNETTRERVNRKGVTKEVRVPARHLYTCLEPTCGFQFSPTAGTIFHDTHLPLEKWFQAVALMCNAKKGLSAKQMERDLGVAYRTAWYLNHRIRKAMEDGAPGLLTGVVEADETYIGGAYDKRRKRERHQTQAVFGAIQRSTKDGETSKVRSFPIPTNGASIITVAVNGTISTEADLFITDEAGWYKKAGKQYHHETINHIKLEYVRKGDPRSIHTNSIENFWSLFNRGIVGSYHKVSVKHLRRYLDEFTFRFNNRKAEDLFGLVMLNLVIATGIKYAELVKNAEEPKDDAEPYSGPRSSYEPW